MVKNHIPTFIDRSELRKYYSASKISQFITISGITFTAWLARRERQGHHSIKHVAHDGGKRYRLLDVIACAIANNEEISPPYQQKLQIDVQQLEKQRISLHEECEKLQRQINTLQDLVRVNIEYPEQVNTLAPRIYSEREIVEKAQEYDPYSVCGVYFLVDNDRVVYVGQSVSVPSRISSHIASGKKFSKCVYIPCDKLSLDALESFYIHIFRPPLNGVHSGKSHKMVAPSIDLIMMQVHKVLFNSYAQTNY